MPITQKIEVKLSTVLTKQKELLKSSVDDETILLSIANSKYYGMDSIASRVWELLDGKLSVQEIVTSLLAEFEVSPVECEQDVFAFLKHLLTENLIVCHNE